MQTIGIVTKHNIEEQKKFLHELVTFLKKQKKKILFDEYSGATLKEKKYTKEEILDRCDLVIVLGGDGTLLKIARSSGEKTPLVLGVNLGNVGFLTEVSPDKLFQTLSEIFKDSYVLDKRFLLRVSLYRNEKKKDSFLALNDVVINQGAFARLITLRMEIDDRKMTIFRADGVIIATPTGSTGHSLSAGGPIIHPKIPAIIVNPICPVSLSMRPIVIPNDRQLKIFLETERRGAEEIGLTMDGQVTVSLRYGDEIRIRKSKRVLSLVRRHGKQYFRMLHRKLRWGES